MDNRKGYKAFKKGLICAPDDNHVKQYEENTTYEEDGGKICGAGMMHYCVNPLDCLNYYPLIDDNGELTEFAEVEALDEPVTDDNKKFATKKLHIGAKLSVKDLLNVSANFFRETITKDANSDNGGDYAQQVGGCAAKQVGGNAAQQVGGYDAQQVGGDYAQQVGGDYAKQVGGCAAKQVGGDYAKQVGGDYAKQVGGCAAKQVGGCAAKQVGGENSVMVAGKDSQFKAGLHSVILHYWYDNEGNIGGFKAAQVDGERIKADTWYKLENGEFVEK